MVTEQRASRCRKCLTREMDGGGGFGNMHEYINNLSPDSKADSLLYENRLACCKECDLLLEGICRGCGCFVELRAAMRKNKCPYGKW